MNLQYYKNHFFNAIFTTVKIYDDILLSLVYYKLTVKMIVS